MSHPLIAPPNRAVVDGVTVLWAPAPGPLQGALVFRTGMVDEAFTERGLTHLVEHLALASLGHPPHHMNGDTGLTTTRFVTQGTPAEVAAFFTEVAANLANLSTDRLETEIRIVQTEAFNRGTWPSGAALAWRFGPEEHGVIAEPEVGLYRADRVSVQEWARQRFTARNAVLWLTGPPPDGLRLPLPPGPRHACPEPRSLKHHYPAWVTQDGPGVAVSMIVPRTTASVIMSNLLEARAMQRLRFGDGVSYSTASTYEWLNAELAHVVLMADSLPENAAAVTNGLSDTVSALAQQGPTGEELRQDFDAYRTIVLDPDSIPGWLNYSAVRELFCVPVEARQDTVVEHAKTTADEVREAAQRAASRSLMMVPPGVEMTGDDLSAYPTWSQWEAAPGREFTPAGPDAKQYPGWRMRLSATALTRFMDERHRLSIRFDQVVGLLAWADGRRILVGLDGIKIGVEPEAWKGAAELVAEIDRRVPAHLVVPMGGHPHPPPSAAAPAASGHRKLGWHRRH